MRWNQQSQNAAFQEQSFHLPSSAIRGPDDFVQSVAQSLRRFPRTAPVKIEFLVTAQALWLTPMIEPGDHALGFHEGFWGTISGKPREKRIGLVTHYFGGALNFLTAFG